MVLTPAIQEITRLGSGLTPSYAAGDAAETYVIPNNGAVFVHVKKIGINACTVTVVTPGTIDGMAIPDYTATVPASTGDKMIGPFPPSIYNDSVGRITVTFSEVTGLTFAVLRLTPTG